MRTVNGLSHIDQAKKTSWKGGKGWGGEEGLILGDQTTSCGIYIYMLLSASMRCISAIVGAELSISAHQPFLHLWESRRSYPRR